MCVCRMWRFQALRCLSSSFQMLYRWRVDGALTLL